MTGFRLHRRSTPPRFEQRRSVLGTNQAEARILELNNDMHHRAQVGAREDRGHRPRDALRRFVGGARAAGESRSRQLEASSTLPGSGMATWTASRQRKSVRHPGSETVERVERLMSTERSGPSARSNSAMSSVVNQDRV